jgi:hypothetical protein
MAMPKRAQDMFDDFLSSIPNGGSMQSSEYDIEGEIRKKQAKTQIKLTDLWNPAMNSVWNEISPFVFGRELRGNVPKCKYDELFLQGGRASGKSYFASVIIWLALENDPQKNAVIIRKVGSSLRKSCWKQMMKHGSM